MLLFPNAKINLGLNVVSKRKDGFHNIESIFYPINIHDALEICESKEKKGNLSQYGTELDCEVDQNLVWKAYILLKEKYNFPSLDIFLIKNIPTGAGLGGGSADAAFLLKMVNLKFGLGLQDDQLEAYASVLGSDCPFFIKNKPVFAYGRGTELKPVDLTLKGWHIVVIHPGIHVSTPMAYSMIKPTQPKIPVTEICSQPVDTWKGILKNDFQDPVVNKYPLIGELIEYLYNKGALYAAMTGSGSAVFGLFREIPEIDVPDKTLYIHSSILE